MNEDTVVRFRKPESVRDVLTQLLRDGAQQLLRQAIEAELGEFLASHAGRCDEQGRAAVVRNGRLPEREVLTGIGPIAVQVPKARPPVLTARGSRRIYETLDYRPPDEVYFGTLSILAQAA